MKNKIKDDGWKLGIIMIGLLIIMIICGVGGYNLIIKGQNDACKRIGLDSFYGSVNGVLTCSDNQGNLYYVSTTQSLFHPIFKQISVGGVRVAK